MSRLEHIKGSLFTLTLALGLSSCQDNTTQNVALQSVQAPATEQRWYSEAQVNQGSVVFAQNCATCHGEEAQGLTEDWRQRLPDGSFPPPPLNGSAHAWHHPLQQLLSTIQTGGVPYGGQMPPFGQVLNDEDSLATVAYFQSFWNEDIYLDWMDRGGLD